MNSSRKRLILTTGSGQRSLLPSSGVPRGSGEVPGVVFGARRRRASGPSAGPEPYRAAKLVLVSFLDSLSGCATLFFMMEVEVRRPEKRIISLFTTD